MYMYVSRFNKHDGVVEQQAIRLALESHRLRPHTMRGAMGESDVRVRGRSRGTHIALRMMVLSVFLCSSTTRPMIFCPHP